MRAEYSEKYLKKLQADIDEGYNGVIRGVVVLDGVKRAVKDLADKCEAQNLLIARYERALKLAADDFAMNVECGRCTRKENCRKTGKYSDCVEAMVTIWTRLADNKPWHCMSESDTKEKIK